MFCFWRFKKDVYFLIGLVTGILIFIFGQMYALLSHSYSILERMYAVPGHSYSFFQKNVCFIQLKKEKKIKYCIRMNLN